MVSLGGGCDVATVLKKLDQRKDRLPFDWLWNLDAGLTSVSEIIATDFKYVRNADDYTYADHSIASDRKLLVYKNYPKIAHIHSNPLSDPEVLEDYNHRIDKFIDIVQDFRTKTVFLYYRNHLNDDVQTEQGCLDTFFRLEEESDHFARMLMARFPEKSFRLVSMLALPERWFKNPALRSDLNRLLSEKKSSNITYEIVPLRDDDYPEKFDAWLREWKAAFWRAGVFTATDVLHAKIRKLARRMRKLRSRFARVPAA